MRTWCYWLLDVRFHVSVIGALMLLLIVVDRPKGRPDVNRAAASHPHAHSLSQLAWLGPASGGSVERVVEARARARAEARVSAEAGLPATCPLGQPGPRGE